MKKNLPKIAAVLTTALLASMASGEVIADFEGSNPLAGWTNDNNWSVITDPTDASNNVLEAFDRDDDQISGTLSNPVIGASATEILEFSFYLTDNSSTDLSIGMTNDDLTSIGESSSTFFGPLLRIDGDQLEPYSGNGSGGGGFDDALQSISTQTWYTVQMTIDNSANSWSSTITGGSFATPTTITISGGTSSFGFRTDTTGDLSNFVIRANTNHSSSSDGAYLDDISIVPEPSTYALLGGLMALGMVIVRRRVRR